MYAYSCIPELFNSIYNVSPKRPLFYFSNNSVCQKLTNFNNFGMLNTQKISHKHLTDLSTSPVRPWTYCLHLSLSSVTLTDSSTKSPVHVLMLPRVRLRSGRLGKIYYSQGLWKSPRSRDKSLVCVCVCVCVCVSVLGLHRILASRSRFGSE